MQKKKNRNFVEKKVAKFSGFFSPFFIYFFGWKSLKTCRNTKTKIQIFFLKKSCKIFRFFFLHFFFIFFGWKSLKTCRNAKTKIQIFFQNGRH